MQMFVATWWASMTNSTQKNNDLPTPKYCQLLSPWTQQSNFKHEFKTCQGKGICNKQTEEGTQHISPETHHSNKNAIPVTQM